MDPASGYIYGAGYSWDELAIVKNPFYLNLLLVTTICLGWISFLVDIILAWCKNHKDKETGFLDEAVLLQGLGVKLMKK